MEYSTAFVEIFIQDIFLIQPPDSSTYVRCATDNLIEQGLQYL